MNSKKLIFILIIVLISASAFARSRKDYFLKPQVGVWFGPIAPIAGTGELLKPNIGVGMFGRYNLPFKSLKIGVDVSYQHYSADSANELYMVPIFGSLVYLLPFNLPVNLQVKGGAGSAYLYANPDELSMWDPLFTAGMEMSFPAGKMVNIGLRIDYLMIYESYKNNGVNGHFIYAGINLYFNLNL